MSKIDLTQQVVNYLGEPFPGDNNKPAQLRVFLINALNGQSETLTRETKERIFQLTTKLWSKNKIDLSLDERSFILEMAGQSSRFSAEIYGRVKEILEGQKPTLPGKETTESPAGTDQDASQPEAS